MSQSPLLKPVGGGICFLGLLLVVILIPVSMRTVSHDEFCIRYERMNKKVHEAVYEEGKHLCSPGTEMFRYGRTIQKMTLEVLCLSSNGIGVPIVVDVQYLIPKSQVFGIFDDFGEAVHLESYLRFVADDSVRDSVGKFTAKSFYESRALIQNTIEEDLMASVRKSNARVNVTTVVLSDYDFPTELDSAIHEKRSAQNDIEIAENERGGEIMEAETAWLTAKIKADRLAIEADAEVESILAEADAKATSIVEVWANRNSTYSNIKTTLSLNSSEFVKQYLSAVVLQAAADPVISLRSL